MVNNPSVFSFLKEDELKTVAHFFTCKTLPANTTVWKEGEPGDYAAFIVSGKVQVTRETEFKANKVVLGIYGRGSYIGAMSVLDDTPRSTTAVALESVCIVIITKNNFDRLTLEHPSCSTALMKGMLLTVSKSLNNSIDRLITIF